MSFGSVEGGLDPAPGVVKPEIGGNVNFKIKSQFMRELKTAKELEEICNFKQEGDETLYKPGKGANSGMTPAQALTTIQTMADHSKNLGQDMKKIKENVHAIQVRCQIYEGTHLDKECPLNEEVKSVEEVAQEEGVPSRVLPCQLPPKELNPGSFTLPCTIGSLNLYDMTDLGGSLSFPDFLLVRYGVAQINDLNWDSRISQQGNEIQGHINSYSCGKFFSVGAGYEFAPGTLVKSSTLAIMIWSIKQRLEEKNTSIGARDAGFGHRNQANEDLKASYGVTTS
uniref:Uncharacterized protein n=1 Tax=Tanacetum cinerariifolium TaxID=118510 RepID=A0A6L2LHN0_TANCI|nr:hypothetical protein [Tanacetum cinerariifolium]